MTKPTYFTLKHLRSKRLFDLFVVVLASIVWVPVLLLCCLLLFIFDGTPLFYTSVRRIGEGSGKVFKFRTMVRNAAILCNRDNSPVSNDVHFLNINSTSNLYTPIGRIIEKATLTELPQLFHVLSGKMTLVGSRPLPENVVASLASAHPNVEGRFQTPAGITGPAQLVGRDTLSDFERLSIEETYCEVASGNHTWQLDFMILLYTVLISVKLKQPMSYELVRKMLRDLGDRKVIFGL